LEAEALITDSMEELEQSQPKPMLWKVQVSQLPDNLPLVQDSRSLPGQMDPTASVLELHMLLVVLM
jgi:hypothetical protein